jgi:hypothetical protein
MVQTFDDLLSAEPSKLGKLAIWGRALWDVPSSALKEHVTNGRGMTMNRNTKLLIAGIALVLLLANGASFWFGYLHARQTVNIERVSPAQLALAMQHDDFYSSYGDTALLFTGKVSALQHENGIMAATFQTGQAYAIVCQFPAAQHPNIGDTISVAAPGGSAERLPHGVLLRSCVEN